MQKLVLESKWEKTISPPDLDFIENVFNQTKITVNEQINFVPIRFAVNHRADLLCTTLIHNFTDSPLDLRKIEIIIKKGEKILTSYLFEEDRLQLDAKTSMPWTFIFPKHTYKEKELDGELTIDYKG
ncbi:SLAP domain-containing protein [Gracilibacillus xinjiangensis]|uniref:SLAP domain-containing protein n=1 Tax=Gracilibacillus xinjiangensis TaxID=1193282 RepID=A0ABV8WQQ8_9BACI